MQWKPVKLLLAVCLVLLLALEDETTQAVSSRPVCPPCRVGAGHSRSSTHTLRRPSHSACPVGQGAELPKCRAHQGWMQSCTHPLASVHSLALSTCSHTVQPSIAAGITWRSEFPSARSWAATPSSFLQAGGQVLLPGPAGSSPLAFRLHEHRLGQRRGGAGGAAGATRFLGWQSRLSCFSCAVQPPSLLHPQLRARWGPISAHNMPLPHVVA